MGGLPDMAGSELMTHQKKLNPSAQTNLLKCPYFYRNTATIGTNGKALYFGSRPQNGVYSPS